MSDLDFHNYTWLVDLGRREGTAEVVSWSDLPEIIEAVRADERERCIQVVNSLKWDEKYDQVFMNIVAENYNATLADAIEAINKLRLEK